MAPQDAFYKTIEEFYFTQISLHSIGFSFVFEINDTLFELFSSVQIN